MNSYDFKTLNDKEFEGLATDLLSAHLKVRIERFKTGKDKGVDGRWFTPTGSEVIIQCKHWVGSGVNQLVLNLAKKERPKLDVLKPLRYIVVTSVALSRINKQAIAAAMAPYIAAETDIYGTEDLNDLLGRHPEVEKRHYKLWLSSANTLALLLNNAILGRSRAELEQIRHEAPLYVMTSDHDRAAVHLTEKRVLVLTGVPGIGKTTLARQLVLEYVANGFELVVLEESISEAEAVFAEDCKQLFYFDDFLGRTFLEAIKAKQDSHILRFIVRIARDASKRFVLTSRTNILNQGSALSDLYSEMAIVQNTYEVMIGTLSTLDRARILYNHIWHSALSVEFVDELYTDKRYHQIIAHKNFNPRLVAFVVDAGKTATLTAATYWAFVQETFNNPAGVWRHFFSAQLSQDDIDLTFMVVLAGGAIREEELRRAFTALLRPNDGNEGLANSRFWRAVQHTAGSVLNRNMEKAGGKATYSLYNPSIADFVESELAASELWAYYFRPIRTCGALQRLEQLQNQPFFGGVAYRLVLEALFMAEEERGHPRDEYGLRLARLLAKASANSEKGRRAIAMWLSNPLELEDHEMAADAAILLALEDGVVGRRELLERAAEIAEFYEVASVPFDEPELVRLLLSTLERIGEDEVFRRLRSYIVQEWQDGLRTEISQNNVLSEYFDTEEAEAASDEVKKFARKQMNEMGIDLSETEAANMWAAIDFADVVADNIKVAARDEEMSEMRGGGTGVPGDYAAVDDLFDRGG